MKRRDFLASTAAVAGAAALPAGLAHAGTKPVKAAWIYTGPVGDFGYSYQHDQGRKEVEAKYGKDVKTSFVENVPEGPDCERTLTQLALDGNDVIFATSFGFMDSVINVAKKFPKVKFEHATGYKRADNVATYSARFYEGRAVIGTIAGKMTKTNTIGYIGSFPIPEVIRGINSAFIHARKVNPDVKFKIVWVSTWFDPAKEADAANALIDQGCDVIMQHTDSTAAMSVAEKKGIYAFGQSSDMSSSGPNACLTSIVDEWGPYYDKRIGMIQDGTWKSTDTWGGIGAGFVKLPPYNKAVPEDVVKLANDLKAKIADGSYHPFTGPLNKQDGTVWLKDGEVAKDSTLLGMNFYVEGIDAQISG